MLKALIHEHENDVQLIAKIYELIMYLCKFKWNSIFIFGLLIFNILEHFLII